MTMIRRWKAKAYCIRIYVCLCVCTSRTPHRANTFFFCSLCSSQRLFADIVEKSVSSAGVSENSAREACIVLSVFASLKPDWYTKRIKRTPNCVDYTRTCVYILAYIHFFEPYPYAARALWPLAFRCRHYSRNVGIFRRGKMGKRFALAKRTQNISFCLTTERWQRWRRRRRWWTVNGERMSLRPAFAYTAIIQNFNTYVFGRRLWNTLWCCSWRLMYLHLNEKNVCTVHAKIKKNTKNKATHLYTSAHTHTHNVRRNETKILTVVVSEQYILFADLKNYTKYIYIVVTHIRIWNMLHGKTQTCRAHKQYAILLLKWLEKSARMMAMVVITINQSYIYERFARPYRNVGMAGHQTWFSNTARERYCFTYRPFE